MPIYKITDESLKQAAEFINNGGLVAFPTETVYGLGSDAFNKSALAKIFEVKNRPHFDPLIVHIAAIETLEKLVNFSLLDTEVKKNLSVLTEKLWPGPLTLILPKQESVPDLATSGLPTVAVRFPANETAQKLIRLSAGAVAAPSANPFGYLSPTKAEHVLKMLGNRIEIILDGGPTQFGVESTVLDICHGQPRILRPGGMSKEAIENLIGIVAIGAADENISSPGMLKSHYAPHVSLTVHDSEAINKIPVNNDSAFLFFDNASRDKWISAGKKPEQTAVIKVLSQSGNLLEAAACLFDILHELDRLNPKQVYAQLVPETGIGMAINDRLRRAAAR